MEDSIDYERELTAKLSDGRVKGEPVHTPNSQTRADEWVAHAYDALNEIVPQEFQVEAISQLILNLKENRLKVLEHIQNEECLHRARLNQVVETFYQHENQKMPG